MPTKSASLYITQIKFCRALAVVRSLPTEYNFQPSVADKLNFYGLYKQAISGDCMQLKPSSSNIVQYAKWKSWERLRGVSPVDAQVRYINALISLLQEFLNRYPNSELTESLTESLNYLQEEPDYNISEEQKENLVEWDTNEQEKQEYYLGEIAKEQLLTDPQQSIQSYLSSPNTSSENLLTPDFTPISPLMLSTRSYSFSPHNYYSERTNIYNSYSKYRQEERNHNQEILYQPSNTIMPSLASATESISFHSSPYQPSYGSSFTKPSKPKRRSRKSSSSSLTATSDKAIQMLQTEVAALCEEIETLRKTSHGRYQSYFVSFISSWRWLSVLSSITKHILLNFLIFTLLFIVLWRRRSPIAYAIIHHVGPTVKEIMYYIFNKIVFWKVTV